MTSGASSRSDSLRGYSTILRHWAGDRPASRCRSYSVRALVVVVAPLALVAHTPSMVASLETRRALCPLLRGFVDGSVGAVLRWDADGLDVPTGLWAVDAPPLWDGGSLAEERPTLRLVQGVEGSGMGAVAEHGSHVRPPVAGVSVRWGTLARYAMALESGVSRSLVAR